MVVWWDVVEKYEEELAPFDPDYVKPKKKRDKSNKKTEDKKDDDDSKDTSEENNTSGQRKKIKKKRIIKQQEPVKSVNETTNGNTDKPLSSSIDVEKDSESDKSSWYNP